MGSQSCNFITPSPLIACLELLKFICYKENKSIPTTVQQIDETVKNQFCLIAIWQPRIDPKTLSTNSTKSIPITLLFKGKSDDYRKSTIEIATSTNIEVHEYLLGWVLEYWKIDFLERINNALKKFPIGLFQIGQEQRIVELGNLATRSNYGSLYESINALEKGDINSASQFIGKKLQSSWLALPTTLEIEYLILSETLEQPEAIARCLSCVKQLNASQKLINYRLDLLSTLSSSKVSAIEKIKERIADDLDNADLHYQLAINKLSRLPLYITIDNDESNFWDGIKGENFWANKLQFSAQSITDATLELNIALFLGLNSQNQIDKANYLLADIKKHEIKEIAIDTTFSLLGNDYIKKILSKRKENIIYLLSFHLVEQLRKYTL